MILREIQHAPLNSMLYLLTFLVATGLLDQGKLGEIPLRGQEHAAEGETLWILGMGNEHRKDLVGGVLRRQSRLRNLVKLHLAGALSIQGSSR